jgi:hypothetical protein
LKEKINELVTYRTKISETYIEAQMNLKKHHQPITNIVKDGNGDLLADSCSIFSMEELLLSAIECT